MIQAKFQPLRYIILVSDVVHIYLLSVMKPLYGLIDSPANRFLLHRVVFVQQFLLDLFLSLSGVYTHM